MFKTLGTKKLLKLIPLLFIGTLFVSVIPHTSVSAEGETFSFGDAAKKTIIMTGGELAKVESPDKIEFKSTDGKTYRADGTKVTLQGSAGTCTAAGQITVEGTKMVFTTLQHNTCEFMNKVSKEGTVSANVAQTNCSTSGTLSWVICPLTDMAQNISKVAAGIVEGLLYVEPLTLNTSSSNAIYTVWELVRNIANIVFIIMFMIIIFSQATSMGLSNYGIKRALPRLLIMAILVNVSYFLCAFAVDVANLIGAGVKGLVQVGIDAAPDPNLGGQKWDGSYGGFIVAAIGAIVLLAVTPPFWTILASLFSIIAFAILIGFVVLVARQVMITLLIIISPLAFAAALLPNTENWFSRWRKTFTAMLVSYPLIMFIFYGAALVATILGTALMPPAK